MSDGPSDTSSTTTKSLVDIYLHQNAALNQLWTTYVVATFAGGTFAITAGQEGGVTLLAAGLIGFLAFTIGHILLIWSGLTRVKLAAEDLRALPETGSRGAVIAKLARPVRRWPSLVCHLVIDACVVGAFIDRIGRVIPPT